MWLLRTFIRVAYILRWDAFPCEWSEYQICSEYGRTRMYVAYQHTESYYIYINICRCMRIEGNVLRSANHPIYLQEYYYLCMYQFVGTVAQCLFEQCIRVSRQSVRKDKVTAYRKGPKDGSAITWIYDLNLNVINSSDMPRLFNVSHHDWWENYLFSFVGFSNKT